MFTEILVQIFVRPILDPIMYFVGYFTAKTLFPIISFGYLIIAPAESSRKVSPKWRGFKRRDDGKILLHHESAVVLGFILWCVIIVFGFFVVNN